MYSQVVAKPKEIMKLPTRGSFAVVWWPGVLAATLQPHPRVSMMRSISALRMRSSCPALRL